MRKKKLTLKHLINKLERGTPAKIANALQYTKQNGKYITLNQIRHCIAGHANKNLEPIILEIIKKMK